MHLTEFYLLIAAGGALGGGIFVSLIAPALFSTFLEWTIALILAFILGFAILYGSCGAGKGWVRLASRIFARRGFTLAGALGYRVLPGRRRFAGRHSS